MQNLPDGMPLQKTNRTQQQQEAIISLRKRWSRWNFPTQELLEQLFRRFGPDAALLSTVAVELSHNLSQEQPQIEDPPTEEA
jgi:hypothetical protein